MSHISTTELIYGNYKVLSPGGQLMFCCGEKKFNWYLNKGLASKIDDKVIQLNFSPNGLGYADDRFYLQYRKNICVVCGSESNLTRHHVVPYCYRKHFPEEAKNHNYYDVLPLCCDCHEIYEAEHSSRMRKNLADKYESPLYRESLYIENPIKAKAIKAAYSLSMHSSKIPDQRQIELRKRIQEYLGKDPTPQCIEELSKIKKEDSSIKIHAKMVMDKIENLQEFVEIWREDFVKSMKPGFLPEGWSIYADAFSGKNNNRHTITQQV